MNIVSTVAAVSLLLAAGGPKNADLASVPSPPTALRVDYVVPESPQPAPGGDSLIFSDDFESDAPPTSRYFEYVDDHGSFVRDPEGGYGGRGGAMKATFEQGQVGAGSLKVLFGRSPFGNRGYRRDETFREIYWRVYVKHEAGWQGNPAKLARATCLATPDWSQGFIAHVWGGKDDVLCIDPATGITDNHRVTTRYNDFAHLRWLGLRNSSTPIFSSAESGRWVLVESHVRLNDPGKKNGLFELWVDGKLEASRDDLDWHGTWSDYAINAVFLENYWNTGAVKRESRWFDDFAIATRRIGPIHVPPNPTFVLNREPGSEWQAQVVADPEGRDVAWESKAVAGIIPRLRVDPARGSFGGARATHASLADETTYWIRLRQRSNGGEWSAWSVCHSPFQTPTRAGRMSGSASTSRGDFIHS